MCGIAGIYNLNSEPVSQEFLKQMCDIMRHRGPDDEGYYIDNNIGFGHRRLSIIDLSPAGHQPMSNDDETIWLVYNGEVYNYVELREELDRKGYSFRTNNDVEVIIKAYEEWDTACLDRFNGMFAFALWDKRKKRLFCARDRFGIKPFYYYFDGKIFLFASEIKAILLHPDVPKRPNDAIIYDYLASKALNHTEETFFEGIKQLRSSHYLVLDAERHPKITKWYDIAINHELGDFSGRRDKEYAEQFLELFTDAIRLRLRSDVPIGSCLSGGLDSSSIVCLANKLIFENGVVDKKLVGERQKTFTASYEDERVDERKYAEEVVQLTGAEKNDVFPDGDMLWEELEKVTWHQDEPFGSTSVYAQWNVFRKAAERGVQVLLDGQGADELLAGYVTNYVPRWLNTLLRKGHLFKMLAEAKAFSDVVSISTIVRNAIRYSLPPGFVLSLKSLPHWRPFIAKNLRQRCGRNAVSVYPGLSRALYSSVLEAGMPTLLHYEDRNSSAFSIEGRVPFLDFRLVEFMFQLPLDQKMRNGWTKVILRNAMKGIIPENIRLRRDKLGFPTPEFVWLRQHQDKIRSLFSSGNVLSKDYLSREWILSNLDNALSERDIGVSTIWRCINLEVWMNIWRL